MWLFQLEASQAAGPLLYYNRPLFSFWQVVLPNAAFQGLNGYFIMASVLLQSRVCYVPHWFYGYEPNHGSSGPMSGEGVHHLLSTSSLTEFTVCLSC